MVMLTMHRPNIHYASPDSLWEHTQKDYRFESLPGVEDSGANLHNSVIPSWGLSSEWSAMP